jgi:hypothetical protein
MIVVKLMGGIGNQMFQYAFAKSLSLKKKQPFKIDTRAFEFDKLRDFELDIFNLQDRIASSDEIESSQKVNESKYSIFLKKMFNKTAVKNVKMYTESSLNFNSQIEFLPAEYFEGYWQSEKYFIQFEQEIRNDFRMLVQPNSYYKEMLTMAIQSESVSIHFRRGDFVSDSKTNEFHGICSLDYYKDAMKYMKEYIGDVTFFMVSDDIEWVKNEFKDEKNIFFVENNRGRDFEDLRLMSSCKHNIIANSSFSWWGAWLNENERKVVIAPKKWYRKDEIQQQTRDLIPDTWLLI